MSESKNLMGTDLKLIETAIGSDVSVDVIGDLEVVSDDMNLAQAILHRLRTIKTELTDIGHPDYGSTIYEIVGEPDKESTRERIKMMVRDTLLQEHRIQEIVKITVSTRRPRSAEPYRTEQISKTELARVAEGDSPDDLNTLKESELHSSSNAVDIDITIIPIGRKVPLNLVFPFYLEVV